MSEPVYFLRLELENVRCFGEKAALDLSDGNGNWRKWTVILGDNGTGKTTLLQCLAGLEMNEKRSSIRLYELLLSKKIEVRSKLNPYADTKVNAFLSPSFHTVGSEIRPDISFTHMPGGEFGMFRTLHRPYLDRNFPMYCFGYGGNRLMNLNSVTQEKPENSETLFDDDAKLINAEIWLLDLDRAVNASAELDVKAFWEKKREQVTLTIRNLLPDVDNIRFSKPTKENIKATVEFKTPYGWVTIHQLSLGYKTMVAWMVDLAARMFERYPDSDNPLAEPAIVLVDEIDLHMHPKWQREIFDYLGDKFPKTQFIVTAHSPLIVQSAPGDANIVVLRREGDYVMIDNNVQSVHGWRVDQIMSSDLFGIESSRAREIEKWLEERKQLLQKVSPLTDTEKKRLKELNEKAYSLPTADRQEDIEAMEIIRQAAAYLRKQPA